MDICQCICGQRLFFENSLCLRCGRRVGWCPICNDLSPLEPSGVAERFTCVRPDCGAVLALCYNYAKYNVCNRCVQADPSESEDGANAELCDMCCFNETIPDLTIGKNLEIWRRLEAAKRRVLRQLQLANLPPYNDAAKAPPLSFDFKADAIPTDQGWRLMGQETVYTGHAHGKITINLREADSVERERLRVKFGESFRTLIGHFRHELAHYLWEARVAGTTQESAFSAVFGDPNDPPYADALKNYYRNGPLPDWSGSFVSAYATMHPFEDWAETTASLLHSHSLLETAIHHGYITTRPANGEELLDRFIELAIFLNELNREMGMLDVMPIVITEPVRRKMLYVRDVLLPDQTPKL